MSHTKQTPPGGPPRIRWQFDADVPTSDFFDDIDLDTLRGLQEAVENFLYWMKGRRFHAWEGVICQEQSVPPTPEQAKAAGGLLWFGPDDDEEDPAESRVLYIDEMPRPTEPWYEILRKIVSRLLLDPFDLTGKLTDVHCGAWNDLKASLVEHAAGLSLPEGVASPLDVIPADLRHRLRLQYCFCVLPRAGYDSLSPHDPDGLIQWFVQDLKNSREAVEYFDLTLNSLLGMIRVPDDQRPHFVRVMQQAMGLESADERLARCLFPDQPPQVARNPDERRSGDNDDTAGRQANRTRRLPADSVKQAILHPDRRIREMAVYYFAGSYSDDASVMPRVIEAVENYGRDGVYMIVGPGDRLPQTAETLDWLIREMNDPNAAAFENYTFSLQRVVAAADPRLLQAREEDIAHAEHMTSWALDTIEQRIEMLSWDSDRCWRELEQHCERYQEAESGSEAQLEEAERIVEALARAGVSESRLLELLAQQVDPHAPTSMRWMEPMLMSLAGRLRLEAAIPVLVDKMQVDDEVLRERGRVALIRIGNDAAVRALAGAFAAGEKWFRYVAADVLQDIHADLAVETALALLPGETDADVGRALRAALLGQFTPEAIEPARRWLLDRGFDDWEDSSLRNQLLRTCDMLGETFPEYEQWSKEEEAEERERLRVLEEMKDNPLGSMIWALEKITGKKAGEVRQELEEKAAARAVDTIVRKTARPAQARVGRNDPCPCGSGKKYKKCCMRK